MTMKKHYLLLLAAIVLSACAGTPVELNRATFNNKKIEAIYLPIGKTHIAVEQSDAGEIGGAGAGLLGVVIGSAIDAGTNSKRNSRLAPVLNALKNYDPATFLTETLQTEAQGLAFNTPLTIETYNTKTKPVALTPMLTPAYTMSPDYSYVVISLSASMKQVGENTSTFYNNYSSIQTNKKEGDENTKRQFWIDNPNELIHQIQAGIYEVVQRFAADFNGDDAAIKPYTLTEPVIAETSNVVPAVEPALLPTTSQANEETQVTDNVTAPQAAIETNYPDIVASLESSDTMAMRAAAIRTGQEKLYHDTGIIAASIASLEKYAEKGVGPKDKFLIDGLSWSALNLGNARVEEAKPVLSKISNSDLPKKLRSHTIHAIKVIDGKARVK